VAVIGLIAAAIYFIFFAPDPFADAKYFCEHEGKDYGCYDENQETSLKPENPPNAAQEQAVKDVLKNGVQKSLG
jgi:hypothetical protein